MSDFKSVTQRVHPCNTLLHSLPDKICCHPFFRFRQSKRFFSQSNTFHQKCHVSCQHTHRLPAFFIHRRFSLGSAMDRVPVLAGRDRHIGYGKILVQLIKGSRTSTAPCTDHTCPDFHRFVKVGAVKQPIQHRDQRRIGRGIEGRCKTLL